MSVSRFVVRELRRVWRVLMRRDTFVSVCKDTVVSLLSCEYDANLLVCGDVRMQGRRLTVSLLPLQTNPELIEVYCHCRLLLCTFSLSCLCHWLYAVCGLSVAPSVCCRRLIQPISGTNRRRERTSEKRSTEARSSPCCILSPS